MTKIAFSIAFISQRFYRLINFTVLCIKQIGFPFKLEVFIPFR